MYFAQTIMDKKPAPLNIIWLLLVVVSVVVAAYNGTMQEITRESFESAKSAVSLAIGLIGVMALWLGIMKVAEAAGLMRTIARAIRPVMVRLFPEVPADHPAMSAMIMNMAANMLGLGNAATPMGIKAMTELDKINPSKETATNPMCLFLAINTSSVTILPLGVITIRAAAGATSPASILIPSMLATACSTVAAIAIAKVLARRDEKLLETQPDTSKQVTLDEDTNPQGEDLSPPGIVGQSIVWLLIGAFVMAVVLKFVRGQHPPVFSLDFVTSASAWLVPMIMCTFLLAGYMRGVKVYEKLVEGAKEGFNVAIRIIPFMVAIFVAIGMFRASGALDLLRFILNPLLSPIGFPTEALPMALLRPLSGSGAFGYMSEVVNNSPNSFVSFLVSTMQGSTETTFYVMAVYFGAIGIRRTRHALPAALSADAVGIVASLLFARLFF